MSGSFAGMFARERQRLRTLQVERLSSSNRTLTDPCDRSDAPLKTAGRESREFESHPLRQDFPREIPILSPTTWDSIRHR